MAKDDLLKAVQAHEAGEAEQHGSHARSQAAHTETQGHVRNSAEGNRKQGAEPGTLVEPPQDPKATGKAHEHR